VTEAAIRALEEAGLAAWPPASLRVDGSHRLGMTLGHPSKRLNCLTVLDPRDTAGGIGRLDREMRLFLRLGLKPYFRQTPLTPPLYADEMDRRGWRTMDETDVMIRDLTAPSAVAAPTLASAQVRVVEGPAAFANTLARLRGHDAEAARQTVAVLERVATGLRLWQLEDDDGPIAVGMGVDGVDHVGEKLIGLFSITTASGMRGRGFARGLTEAILLEAANRGVAHAWLQVEVDNDPAQRLYRSLGFVPHHQYRYRVPLGF
jgi:ribosomal protein S18 acetylase RimI-like enzyme